MTAFSLRLTRGANAVSQLHAETANATWQGVVDHPILGITNGVHGPTWIGQPIARAARALLGADLDDLDDDRARRPLLGAPRRGSRRASCGTRTCARSASSRSSRAAGCAASSPATARRRRVLAELETALDPDVLTIGFARRFATYKRAGLLFSDIDRLARMLWDEERPVQIVFAGKAHPADRPGQRVIQEIFSGRARPQLRGPGLHPRGLRHAGRAASSSRASTSGSTTRAGRSRRRARPGMKAAQNGVPNVSVLDGWWDEGWTGDNGWAIGGRETNPDEGAQDWARRAGPLPDPRGGDRARATTSATRRACRRAGSSVMRRAMATHALALLDDPDAPRVRRAALPAGRRRHRRRARRPQPRRDRSRLGRPARRWPPRISLALAIHNHQPVGNFGWVFAEVYEQAYVPMVEALERHPGVRLVAPLHRAAARLAARRATRVPRAARGARRRATRSRSSAAATTSRSSPRCRSATASASCARMADELERDRSGGGRAGAWLAERVWEPDLPTALVDARLRLDDPRRRALPGRGDPRGRDLWGAVHDRGPGPAC